MHITRFKELDQKIMLDRVKMELYIYRWVSKVVWIQCRWRQM